jgi:ABC-2 type transport system permease protein
MAVYKRTYRGYSGALTKTWSRFLVLYRTGRAGLFTTNFQRMFLILCFFYPLLCAVGIYLEANLSSLSFLGGSMRPMPTIDNNFFLLYLRVQAALAFVLACFIGPGLVSPDLGNGALTLYLCRPLSRTEYILGKMSVLFITLAYITWIPGLLLFFIKASLSGWHWFASNLWMAGAILVGSLLWNLLLSLIALALSAWVRWRIVAGALLLATFFGGAGFARAINAVLQTQHGYLLDISYAAKVIWSDLFRTSVEGSFASGEAWFSLLAVSTLCLYLLLRKIRANEVVR